MNIAFRDPSGFYRETLAVTGGAAAAGLAIALVGFAPLEVAGGAAALLGGSVAAALTRARPTALWLRGVVGVVGGTLAALGFAALSSRLGLGTLGVVAGGALGGLALGSLLSSEDRLPRLSQLAGLSAATVVGAVGAVGISRIAAYAASEGVSPAFTTATMAGAFALWLSAAAGARRVQAVRDPLLDKAEEVLQSLADPMREKLIEGIGSWGEIEVAIDQDAAMADEARQETRKQARLLCETLVETARTWSQIHADISTPKVQALEAKVQELEKKAQQTTDGVTRGHLTRALAALHAQRSAVDGLKVGLGRAEAAADAQIALLERLRLAVAQHRVSDGERFDVELTAVAEQAGRLSDDLETLSQAIAEAESLADRRALADLERGARKAIVGSEVAQPSEHEQHTEATAHR